MTNRTPLASKFTPWFMVLATPALLGGCGEDPVRFRRLVYEDVSLAPQLAELEPRRITLTEGIAVSARVIALDSEDHRMAPLELEPDNPSILGVDRGAAEDAFIFYGVSVGQTDVAVVVDGRTEGIVDGEVVAQTEP